MQTHVPALARALKIEWPCNVLRHSFISCRIAVVQSADQVALESGNSPSIIFKHYRELTTPEIAEKWFAIVPGWSVGRPVLLRPEEGTRGAQRRCHRMSARSNHAPTGRIIA